MASVGGAPGGGGDNGNNKRPRPDSAGNAPNNDDLFALVTALFGAANLGSRPAMLDKNGNPLSKHDREAARPRAFG